MSSTSISVSELELKRMAVLASIKKKKPLSVPPISLIEEATPDNLYSAILDLRSMGYTFNKIVELSGVQRDFLKNCYHLWKFPVPPLPTVPATATLPVSIQQPVPIRYQSATPPLKQRKLYGNRTYVKEQDRPEWLDDLVIDLASSDEEAEEESEESDSNNIDHSNLSDSSDQRPESTGLEVITEAEFLKTAHIENVSKKRSFNDIDSPFNESKLEQVREKKLTLKKEIDSTSKKMKKMEKEHFQIDKTISTSNERLSMNKTKLLLIQSKLETLQQEILNDEESLRTLILQKDEMKSLKDNLANDLIKLEDLNKEEQEVLKEKKQYKQSTKKKENQDPDLPVKSEIYDETIHKIPKVIISV